MALVPVSRRRHSLARLPDRFDELFGRFFGEGESELFGGGGWCPALDIAEKDDSVVVRVELPGLKSEDIEISVDRNMLTVSGEKKDESETTGENSYHVERRYGKFTRTISLPGEVNTDKIEAAQHEGVLTITLPKSEAAKPRKISVK